jgi:hypothetical protein
MIWNRDWGLHLSVVNGKCLQCNPCFWLNRRHRKDDDVETEKT